MACEACERRRKDMALMMEAARQWTANPVGQNVMDIYARLRKEAMEKGDL